MKKYKLIKEYPGSPYLGTICEERNNKSSFCYYFEGEKNIGITKDQVENQPEYWEEVEDNIYWVVFTKEETSFETYKPYKSETFVLLSQDSIQYFKTKEEAETFILLHKPCLSLYDIKEHIKSGNKAREILSNIYHIVKSRL